MQKWIRLARALLLAALLLTVGGACLAEEKLRVVTTIFPQYDFVREIAGDKVELSMLLKPGAEAHSYEPAPQDVIAIQQSDLFVYVGGESETWVKTILESAGSDTRREVALMELVELHEEDEEATGAQGHEHEHEGEYDEHVWTSPVNAMKIVQALTDELAALDPANADYYRENAEAYLEELAALDASFREVVEAGARRELVFGDRFPLTYFVNEYGLTYVAAFPGCASETEASAATIARLIKEITEQHIPTVFYIELSNHQIADTLAEQTGAQTQLFYTCHNVTADDFAAGLGYLDLMQRNIEALSAALGAAQ